MPDQLHGWLEARLADHPVPNLATLFSGANAHFVRDPIIAMREVLRDERTAGMRKLHRGILGREQWPVKVARASWIDRSE